MEYAEGKIIEQFLDERLLPMDQKINWIIQAMRDNKVIPKSEQEAQKIDIKGV